MGWGGVGFGGWAGGWQGGGGRASLDSAPGVRANFPPGPIAGVSRPGGKPFAQGRGRAREQHTCVVAESMLTLAGGGEWRGIAQTAGLALGGLHWRFIVGVADFGRCDQLARVGPMLTNVCHIWPNPGPTLTRFGPNIGETWPALGQHRPNSGQRRPMSSTFGQSGQTWGRVGRALAELGQMLQSTDRPTQRCAEMLRATHACFRHVSDMFRRCSELFSGFVLFVPKLFVISPRCTMWK